MEKSEKNWQGPEIKKAGDSERITREYFDSLLIEQRLMEAAVPDTSVTLFGQRFATPITTAALSHLGAVSGEKQNGMELYAEGAKLADTLHWVGMCENDEFEKIMDINAKTVRVIKPYEDEDKIYSQIACAKERGAIAVGMDIDHVFSNHGDLDLVLGEQMAVKTMKQMMDYKKAAGLPFVVKGILSVRDAARALEMGADAVSVGKHLIPVLQEGGSAGVQKRILEMTQELKGVMAYTGVMDTGHFDATVIRIGKN